MILTTKIVTALISACNDAGIYSDKLNAAVESAEGLPVDHTEPLYLDGCDYPTKIVLASSAVKGDILTVEYRTNAGTRMESAHVAGKIYLRNLA